MSERTCTKCGETKLDEKFPCSKTVLSTGEIKKYRENTCYSCKYKKERADEAAFKEKKRVYRKKYNAKNPANKLLWNSKSRAKKLGVDFNLTIEDIEIPDVCPLLNILLYSEGGKIIDNSPSLDRIDSKQGYVRGNVWVISHKANTMKSDASLDEIERLAKNLRMKIEGAYSS